MVVKDDPTLMFTNAGMNQFKDVFLGNTKPVSPRIANTQKCLRVSGKHNDLEEVGHDTYHHTMFEMLGNWSFGDYFKKEAIEWAWELLTKTYGIPPDDLYVTVFGGDESDGLVTDEEAYRYWKEIVPSEKILYGSRKDNFWEMGDTGPCGPCSEIHIDLRSDREKKEVKGSELVNKDHPGVIEIWNLVFIEFNRKSDGKLVQLPSKHVDTGMGFERLCMVLQGKTSNYDTDIFQPLIKKLEEMSGKKYGDEESTDIAMRVVADHLRAVVFAIADGQLPSNVRAGYVIRRILRRAVRYGFTYLGLEEPFIHRMIDVLVDQMGEVFPEIEKQKDLIVKVVTEEEIAFLRTLSNGIRKFEQYLKDHPENKAVDGEFAFELFDTYGFPVDLTRLMAREKGLDVDMEGFGRKLEEQKERSRSAAGRTAEDWIVLRDVDKTEFVGYRSLKQKVRIVRYREVKEKKGSHFQIVLDKTPFYSEAGGQVGDTGYLEQQGKRIPVLDTIRENELSVHITREMPVDPEAELTAVVDKKRRKSVANNHSATHLMHAALRKVLGDHVEQKGSLVDAKHLRFDFSHYAKLTDEEIEEVEKIVNARIRDNIPMEEHKEVPMQEALDMGAIALFGEKYGEKVRVVSFDPSYSVELCGGTHVTLTGTIGIFKIISESNIAAGIRRIEAVTGEGAETYLRKQSKIVQDLKTTFKTEDKILQGVRDLIEQNNRMHREVASLANDKARYIKRELIAGKEEVDGVNFISGKVDLQADVMKNLAYMLKKEVEDVVVILASVNDGKVALALMISENLLKQKGLHAGSMIRDLAKLIGGGGGGQPFFATAGGRNPEGVEKVFSEVRRRIGG